MNPRDAILITGANGMLGRAVVEWMRVLGFINLLVPSRSELDLTIEEQVDRYVLKHKPAYVFHLASTVFGLKGNLDNQFKSLVENTKIYGHLLSAIAKSGSVKKVFFAGTVASYAYPYLNDALNEEDLFKGLPHYGEFGYAMAKRHAYSYLEIMKKDMGIDYVYGLLTNLYGENDTFDEINGHVIPSLIKKAVQSKVERRSSFVVWGNPESERDFLYVKDAAKASIFLMQKCSGVCNIATGLTVSIRQVANCIADVVGGGRPIWDPSAPIGIDKRSVSSNKLKSLGYADFSPIEGSLSATARWYMEQSK